MFCEDDIVVGFAVGYVDGASLVIVDLQLDSQQPMSRVFEAVHGLTAWPSFAEATMVELEESCAPELREAAAVLSVGPRAVRPRDVFAAAAS